MERMFRVLTIVIALSIGLTGILEAEKPVEVESLTIGAPPSLRPALSDILHMFEREYDLPVSVVYTPSKTLRQQIERGTPIDVFLSAGIEEVEVLYKKGLTRNGRPRVYAQTSLVLVMSSKSLATSISFQDALADRTIRIALGDPQTSSLGEVTARALAKIYPSHKNSSQIVYAPHSEDIMDMIIMGKADVGLIYRVDSISNGQVRISDETPIGTYMPIRFGQSVVWTCRDSVRPAAEQFSDFLMTPRIQMLLAKYGFDAIPVPLSLTPVERKERIS